jgi:hypothetical protein
VETPEKQKNQENKAKAEEVKTQWKQMSSERFNDKTLAEGVSAQEYNLLKVDKGLVIQATRDFKAPDLKEALDQNNIENSERYIAPPKEVGGWHKFAKTKIIPNTPKSQRAQEYKQKEAQNKKSAGQPKKGGRGWLHTN